MMPNIFATQIGTPKATKRRKRASESTNSTGAAAWYSPAMSSTTAPPPNAPDARRGRLSNATRKQCLRLAFDVLDPEHTGVIAPQTLRDIADEIEYLIKSAKSEQDRDTQRFMVEHPEEYMSTKELDERALTGAHDLDVTSEEEEDEPNSDSDDADLKDFIVATDEEEEEEHTAINDHTKHKRVIKHIPVDEEEEQEEEEEGTHLSEVD